MKIAIALFALLSAWPAGATKLKVTEARVRFEGSRATWKVRAKVCNKTSAGSDPIFYEIRLYQLAEPISQEVAHYTIARWTDDALAPGACQDEELPVTVDTSKAPADDYHVVLWIGDGSGPGRKRLVANEHYLKHD